MKIEIKDKKDNPMMKREELKILINHEGAPTPTKASVQQVIAKEIGADITSVEIVNIFSKFGSNVSDSLVFKWSEKKVDDLSKVKKTEDGKEASAEGEVKDAPEGDKAAKSEEKPAEDKEDAPKEEVKKEGEAPKENEAAKSEEKPAEDKK